MDVSRSTCQGAGLDTAGRGARVPPMNMRMADKNLLPSVRAAVSTLLNPAVPGSDRAEKTGQECLGTIQSHQDIATLHQVKEYGACEQKYPRCNQHDFGVKHVVAEIQFLPGQIIPDNESDAACDNQEGYVPMTTQSPS